MGKNSGTTSLNQITADLAESAKKNNNGNNSNEKEDSDNTAYDSDEEEASVTLFSDPIAYIKSLPRNTQYYIAAGSVAFIASFFLLSFWKFTIIWILVLLCVFGYWFASTDLSVEITVFLAKFFPPSKQALWDTKEFEWTKKFRDNHEIIYNEYLEFEKQYNYCPQMDDVFPNGSITNWDRKWPTVTLRCYGLDSKASKFFPKTMALLNDKSNKYWLSHCMFSILEPDKFIPRHRGPYRGVFRYQLALEIPPCNDANRLYLAVWPGTSSYEFWHPENVPDGEPQTVTWKVGEDFIFDDTCVHEVRNNTVCRRIILFMDVERHDISLFSRLIHKIFMGIARFLPAVKQACHVQDQFIKDDDLKNTQSIDPNNEVDSVEQPNNNYGNNNNNNDDWIYYRQARVPELAPYKRARVLIDRLKKSGIKRKSVIQ